MNDYQRSQQKVSLEELLRLKRAERPSPEFWSAFETDLRAKQLAAIVEKRPWWVSMRLPQAYRAFARFQLPVGAAAAVALTFVVVREYQPSGAASSSPSVNGGDAVVAMAGSNNDSPSAGSTALAPAAAKSAAHASAGVIAKTDHALTSLVSVTKPQPHSLTIVSPRSESRGPDDTLVASTDNAPASGMLTEMIPWGAAPEVARNIEPAHVAGEVAELQSSSFVSDALPGRDHDFKGSVEVVPVYASVSSGKPSPSEVVAASAEIVSSSNMVAANKPAPASSQRELRRSRILSTLVADSSEISNAPMAISRDVLAGDLSDDRNFNPMSRVGMGGDRLTLKF